MHTTPYPCRVVLHLACAKTTPVLCVTRVGGATEFYLYIKCCMDIYDSTLSPQLHPLPRLQRAWNACDPRGTPEKVRNGRGAGGARGGCYNCCARGGASTEEERVGTFDSPGDTLAMISKEAKKDTSTRSIFLVPASPPQRTTASDLPWAQRSRRAEINLATKLMSSSLTYYFIYMYMLHATCTWFISGDRLNIDKSITFRCTSSTDYIWDSYICLGNLALGGLHECCGMAASKCVQ